MKTGLFMLAILFSHINFAQTSLSGKITETNGEPVILGNVIVYQNGNIVTGTETDFDGNYTINNLEPGTYDVEASYVGMENKKLTGVVVFAGKANALDLVMLVDKKKLYPIYFLGCGGPPLIQQDHTTSGGTFSNIRRGAANFSFTTSL